MENEKYEIVKIVNRNIKLYKRLRNLLKLLKIIIYYDMIRTRKIRIIYFYFYLYFSFTFYILFVIILCFIALYLFYNYLYL